VKRLLFPAVAVGAAVFAVVPLATAKTEPTSAEATPRTVCHRTSSSKRPYVKLRVNARQQRAHLRHPADIFPAPRGACPRTLLTATRGGTAIAVAMTGEAEAPTAGEPVGTGTATIRLRRGQGQLCYSMRVRNITLPAAAAHIHRGGTGEAGPVIIPLRAPNASGVAAGCRSVSRTLVAQILRNRQGYYVNVHTTEFPGGAVRGQLAGTSQSAFGFIVTVQLTGAAECNAAGTCNLGDPDGTGTSTIRLIRATSYVCYRTDVQNILLPSVGMHIHRGARTSAGGIVVNMEPPNAAGVSRGCTLTPVALIDEIAANPSAFYVNVHTTDRPAGAVRAQLG
jgi:hypothetical protein